MNNQTIWKKIPLHNFGFKCINNNHNLCKWEKCLCLCHKKKTKHLAKNNCNHDRITVFHYNYGRPMKVIHCAHCKVILWNGDEST